MDDVNRVPLPLLLLVAASPLSPLGARGIAAESPPQVATSPSLLEANLLLHTGLLDDVAALAMGSLRGDVPQPEAEAEKLLTALEESQRALAQELAARREEIAGSPEWLSRHDAFALAQTELYTEVRGLLLDLATAGRAELEAAARRLLGWIERELGRNGIDLTSPPRPIAGSSQRAPRRPITDRSLVRPAARQAFAPVSPADTLPDPTWQNRWEKIRAQASRFVTAEEAAAWVRDQIELEPGFGFLQHPLAVLQRGRGNDFDQAALLVALLRGMNVPARFLYLSVHLARDGAAGVQGTSDLIQVGQFLSAEGRPAVLVRDHPDQPPLEVHLEHIVVEYYVDSRRAWVMFDPSFGGKAPTHTLGPPAVAPEPPAAVAADLGEITEQHRAAWERLLIRTSLDLEEARPPGTAGAAPTVVDQVAARTPLAAAPDAAAPYQILAYLAEFQELPAKLCVQLELELSTSAGTTRLGPFPLAGLDPPVALLDAADADPQVGASASLLPLGERPHYLVRLHPHWRLPGEPPRVVSELVCRSTFPWSIAATATRPFLPSRTVRKSLRPGSLLAIAWGSSTGDEPLPVPAAIALGYLGALDQLDRALGAAARVAGIAEPPVIAASTAERIYNHPLERFASRGLQLTVDQLMHSRSAVPLQPHGDGDRYVLASGMVASALEHRILERVTGLPALSTARLLGEAPLDPELVGQLRTYQADGQFGLQLLPPVAVGDWTGSAELVLALPSLAGRYDLSGRIAGGVVTRRSTDERLAGGAVRPRSLSLPEPGPTRVAAMACGTAAVRSSVLLARPAALIHACWASTWLVDGWLPASIPASAP